MQVRWKEKGHLKPNIILSKIDSIKIIDSNKKVSYSELGYIDAITALIGMIDFPRHCDGLNHGDIVAIAVTRIARDHALNMDNVIGEINRIVSSELAKKEQKFYLLTSISIDLSYPLKKYSIEDTKIRIMTDCYPKKYQDRNQLVSHYSNIIETPENYARVIVSVKEKSAKGAGTKALRSLDILRSIWCIFGNPDTEISRESWKWRWVPINKIRLGSIHSLHRNNGRFISEILWYEPNFLPATLFKHQKPDVFFKSCKLALEKLAKIPYNNIIKDALLRYVRALDEKDQNTALIRLWGALETLTDASGNHNLVTKRCSFLFTEHDYHKQILEHLREHRNSNAHSGDQNENAKLSCFQLQRYFRALLLFHLKNQGYFSSIKEANIFLDLSTDKKVLETKKRLIEKAIKFIQ